MPDEATTTENDAAPESTGDDEAKAPEGQQPTESETDWKVKAEGQQKVNRDLERKLKDARTKADEAEALKAELAKLQGKEAEYAEQQKAREAEHAALQKANERIIRSEVKAAAKGTLADPADAYKFLALDEFEVDDDGNVDEAQIAKAIEDLVADKPYLAAQGKRFQGGADGGARNESTKSGQLTEAEVKKMAAEGKHDEIVKAKAEGRLTDYLAS